MNNFILLNLIPMFVGLAYIIAAFIIIKYPPKKINYWYGYRTPLSMRNQKNWDFAQIYSAKEFIKAGFVLLMVSVYLFNSDYLSHTWIVVTILLSVMYGIIRTELAIKKNNRQKSDQ